MKYTKLPKTFEEQADILIERGLIADKKLLVERLNSVNYYRLSGYFYPFKDSDENFKKGTTFDEIWRRYTFDRQLRLLLMDAIERIEIKARTIAAYTIAHQTNPFDYSKHEIFPRLTPDRHSEWFDSIKKEAERNNEVFTKHFFSKYGDEHNILPIWMAAEIMSFGNIVRIFKGYDAKLSKSWSSELNIPDKVLESWLLSLNYIRNLCAHHSRLWDRNLSMKPLLPNPKKHKELNFIDQKAQAKIFVIIAICNFILKNIAPQSKWIIRLCELFKKYEEIPFSDMGFPENWKDFIYTES